MKRIKVLVVDDAAFVRDLVRKGLRDHFPTVEISDAGDGTNARMWLEKAPFDLVLCDWEMPNMPGDELLQWMRANPNTQHIPFIMITSRGERENVMRAIELKADNYIVKPFTTDKLIGVVSRVLSRSLNIPEETLRGVGKGGLTGGRKGFMGDMPIAETITADSTVKPAAAEAAAKPLVARPREKVLTQMRFGTESSQVLVKEVTPEQIKAVMRRESTLPSILDMVVMDLETKDGSVARMNGYVHTLQARENRKESEFINVTVAFVDDDPDKLEHLRHYIEELG